MYAFIEPNIFGFTLELHHTGMKGPRYYKKQSLNEKCILTGNAYLRIRFFLHCGMKENGEKPDAPDNQASYNVQTFTQMSSAMQVAVDQVNHHQ